MLRSEFFSDVSRINSCFRIIPLDSYIAAGELAVDVSPPLIGCQIDKRGKEAERAPITIHHARMYEKRMGSNVLFFIFLSNSSTFNDTYRWKCENQRYRISYVVRKVGIQSVFLRVTFVIICILRKQSRKEISSKKWGRGGNNNKRNTWWENPRLERWKKKKEISTIRGRKNLTNGFNLIINFFLFLLFLRKNIRPPRCFA